MLKRDKASGGRLDSQELPAFRVHDVLQKVEAVAVIQSEPQHGEPTGAQRRAVGVD